MSSSSPWPDEEEHTSKFMRKAKESPFVPIGKVNTVQPFYIFLPNVAFLLLTFFSKPLAHPSVLCMHSHSNGELADCVIIKYYSVTVQVALIGG